MKQFPSRRRFFQRAALFSGGLAAVPLSRPRPAGGAGPAVYSIVDFGAVGDGRTNDAAALQGAIDHCTEAGGGTVLVPPGRFLTGSFQLKSHVHLHLSAGSELVASPDRAHYRGEALIEATGARNLVLSGHGTIDAQGRRFMREELPHRYRAGAWRPGLMVLENCRNVRLHDVTLRESARWTVHLAGCDDVTVRGLSILNDLRIPDCDGIAVDCSRNVRISDCHIEAGDDCIVLKTLRRSAHYGPCENVTVSNCTLASTSAALKIGTETVNDIRNVIFRGCVIRASSRGLGILLRDEGTVENVLFSDLTVETRYPHLDWWGAAEPIHVSAHPRAAGRPVGRVRNVRFSNILCRSENGVLIHGSPESRPEDIRLEGVKVRLEKWSDLPGGRHDLRPSDGPGLREHATAGIHIEGARDVVLHRCTVEWGAERPPYFGHALLTRGVEGFENLHFKGESARPGCCATLHLG